MGRTRVRVPQSATSVEFRREKEKRPMKVNTNIKSGRLAANHNAQARQVGKATGLRVRTSVKAGGINTGNHNQTLMRAGDR
jgi:hypothetical protein